MIIFFADGKLGNQIFQYAFLNTIAKQNEIIISTGMQQLSDTFDIKNKKFKQITSNKYLGFILRKVVKTYLLQLLVKIKLIGYIKQNRNKTSALPILTIKKGLLSITLVESNFFQAEAFFDDKSLDICIKKVFIDEAENIIISIPENFTKVFVHIRRGDYTFEKYLDTRGIALPRKYFIDAIQVIKEKVKNPYFIFLSDDYDYCKCCFKDIKNKYISKNSMKVDLAIMTLCEYGIVSNSSFSWWGAYLMKDKKEVIFPKYWYGWKQKIESHVGIQPKWGEIMDVIEK